MEARKFAWNKKQKKIYRNNANDNFGNISAQVCRLHNPGRHAADFQYHDLRLFVTYHVCTTTYTARGLKR